MEHIIERYQKVTGTRIPEHDDRNELMQQQLDNLGRKERILEEENSNMYRWIQEHRAATEYQQGGTEAKAVEHQQILDEFPSFYGGAGDPSSVLQLATIPQQFPYQLHLAHPNLQHSNV
ncbi:hypothetical protein V6N13_114794 [Hibiscus sabdariffa]